MPHYLIQDKGRTPVLVHEAPLDEKTKEIRKQFDVDEKTGYPRMYNWRPLAHLGPDYRPENIYELFEPYKPKEKISTKVTLVGGMAAAAGTLHYILQRYHARPLYTKAWKTLGYFGVSTFALLYYYDYKDLRNQQKNEIYADYMKKHPERFDTVHRPKFREVLFEYTPIR